jgi:D-sedoheptulose 7-phosphate isomerase
MKGVESAAGRFVAGIEEGAQVVSSLKEQVSDLVRAATVMLDALHGGHKILAAGNGGSAAEAMHLAEELTGRYRSNRKPLPAVALASDGTALTCIGNDFGFDQIFRRQVMALGQAGDVLVVFSTSGNSANLILAVEAAQEAGMKVVNLLGRGGGALAGRGDVSIVVKSNSTAHVQEAHQVILHLLLERIEEEFGV